MFSLRSKNVGALASVPYVAVFLTALLSMSKKCVADGSFDLVTHSITGFTETWRVDRPNVTRRLSEYPQIRFSVGDRVTIDADGCVQTGGFGSTWKLYVNPWGGNTSEYYHGLIWVPGANASGAAPVGLQLVRIAAIIRRPLTIQPGFNAAQSYLRLGYEDDDYSDNSYDDHDDGQDDQCKGVGPAWVTIFIEHNPSPDSTPAPASAPFDLLWDNLDDDGIARSPFWAYQKTHADLPRPEQFCSGFPNAFFDPRCTTQVPNIDNGAICSGHVNWAAATYQGILNWSDHSSPIFDDDDYALELQPLNTITPNVGTLIPNGLTAGHSTFHLEFNSDETVDHFRSAWWEAFHGAVSAQDFAKDHPGDPFAAAGRSAPNNMVRDAPAIVSGLIGLDCFHSCSIELHPVWAMAIQVERGPTNEEWAIFVRNWGDEGYCSDDQHYLDLASDPPTYRFRLPWRPGATAVSVGLASGFLSGPDDLSPADRERVAGPFVEYTPNEGVLVTFTLPRPEAQAHINGQLYLDWSGPTINRCAMEQARLAALTGELNSLTSGIPGYKTEAVYDAAMRRVEEWHQAHDDEVNRLRQRLASPQCQPGFTGSGASPNTASLLTRSNNTNVDAGESPENRVAELISHMTPSQKRLLQSRLASLAEKPISRDLRSTGTNFSAVRVDHLPPLGNNGLRASIRSVRDVRRLAKDRFRLDALRSVLGANLPVVSAPHTE